MIAVVLFVLAVDNLDVWQLESLVGWYPCTQRKRMEWGLPSFSIRGLPYVFGFDLGFGCGLGLLYYLPNLAHCSLVVGSPPTIATSCADGASQAIGAHTRVSPVVVCDCSLRTVTPDRSVHVRLEMLLDQLL